MSKQLRSQAGFIPLLLTVLFFVLLVIVLVFLRVRAVQH